MELRESLVSLNEIYLSLMEPGGGMHAVDAQDFADAWSEAKQFRDHSLLLLAKHTYSAVKVAQQETFENELSEGHLLDVSKRLVDFTFKFFTMRQIAFTFDLAASLVDSEEFEHEVNSYAATSPFANQSAMLALRMGLDGSALFDPERLIAKKSDFVQVTPIFSVSAKISKINEPVFDNSNQIILNSKSLDLLGAESILNNYEPVPVVLSEVLIKKNEDFNLGSSVNLLEQYTSKIEEKLPDLDDELRSIKALLLASEDLNILKENE